MHELKESIVIQTHASHRLIAAGAHAGVRHHTHAHSHTGSHAHSRRHAGHHTGLLGSNRAGASCLIYFRGWPGIKTASTSTSTFYHDHDLTLGVTGASIHHLNGLDSVLVGSIPA